ncbi:MAG: aminotransferase class V-fold PLP-dependent enzyme [Solirubrobacteraceae bacterium]
MPSAAEFRAEFPVLERLAYLNAGTEGPLPRRAAEAVNERLELELTRGRAGAAYIETIFELAGRLRDGYARVLGADPTEVALTGSTTDGVNSVLAGLALAPGDEIVTSDEEHPGVLAPLARARDRAGVNVRVVGFEELAGAVTASTRLVACSHVSWVSGRVVDAAALAATGVPVLLDGAQGVGAVPVDVRALGCAFYAGSGQKWLCGPEGAGCLYVRADLLDELSVPWPGYISLADAADALHSPPALHAARFDLGFPPGVRSVWALASLEVLESAGWDWVHERAASLAARAAVELSQRGLEVWPRGRSTLVSWRSPADDLDAEVARLAAAGFRVRSIPSRGLIRASVGAWSAEEELDRLAATAAESQWPAAESQ